MIFAIAIPLLKQHIELLIDRYEHFSTSETKPDDLGELFTPEWTSAAIASVVTKGVGHLTQVCALVASYGEQASIMRGRVSSSGTPGTIGSSNDYRPPKAWRGATFWILVPPACVD